MNVISLNERGKNLIKATEIARMLSVDAKTVHNWSEKGLIPVAYRLGSTVRFDLEDVRRALAETTSRETMNRQERRKVGSGQKSKTSTGI